MARQWTTKEVTLAKQRRAKYVAAVIGRTEHAVRQMKWRLGISDKPRPFSTDEDQKIREMRMNGKPHKEIAAIIGRNEDSTRARWSKIRMKAA